ncbi:hypothetical protein [Corynebacterium ulcerans]|uniref:hypothetical protein n=1 Tax=Corynebacterium ulcerans TaxID=65058 RepID=UPI000269D0EC|nr:hypothetical protein [Corynebacterium ulcerans]KPJ24726.1 hypothetical protein AOT31_02630 [Corynebacterium ulcerans]BAM26755.1 hypothetical protein CULC0102_0554 [Corynebacterium ulcerans 0102]BBJ71414.1 hypothetical protein CULC0211_05480 [Corynebacterium ulcerans]BBJ73719.1 hypothetical protein CULCFH20161_05460 [Corynebacterium ulcerans]BDV25295.1 hypothetical protein CULTSU28_05430 [Corynebacterium ulcerans]
MNEILKKIEENAEAIAAVRAESEKALQERDRLIWQASRANTPRARIMEASGLSNSTVGDILGKDPDRAWYSRQPR